MTLVWLSILWVFAAVTGINRNHDVALALLVDHRFNRRSFLFSFIVQINH